MAIFGRGELGPSTNPDDCERMVLLDKTVREREGKLRQ